MNAQQIRENEEAQRKTLAEIDRLQSIQKVNHPDSAEWRHASRQLAPRFAKMAGLVRELGREVA